METLNRKGPPPILAAQTDKRQPEIQEQIEHLSKSASVMADAIGSLEQKLGPVSRSEPLPSSVREVKPCLTGVGQALQEIDHKLLDCCDRIFQLRNMLEI